MDTPRLFVQVDREDDGRWIAEVLGFPGVMVYGQSRDEVVVRVEALALRVLADRLEHGEDVPELSGPRMLARIARSTGLRLEVL